MYDFSSINLSLYVNHTCVLHLLAGGAIAGQLLLAILVFCLFEIGRPIFDFGILQFFLRLPVLSSLLSCGFGLTFFGTAGLMVVLTGWNCFYLSSFEREWNVMGIGVGGLEVVVVVIRRLELLRRNRPLSSVLHLAFQIIEDFGVRTVDDATVLFMRFSLYFLFSFLLTSIKY